MLLRQTSEPIDHAIRIGLSIFFWNWRKKLMNLFIGGISWYTIDRIIVRFFDGKSTNLGLARAIWTEACSVFLPRNRKTEGWEIADRQWNYIWWFIARTSLICIRDWLTGIAFALLDAISNNGISPRNTHWPTKLKTIPIASKLSVCEWGNDRSPHRGGKTTRRVFLRTQWRKCQ